MGRDRIYADAFSEDELRQVIAFYSGLPRSAAELRSATRAAW
jgi:hypothetical protein